MDNDHYEYPEQTSTNKRDGGEVELLPLPDSIREATPGISTWWRRRLNAQIRDYARANVERALAEGRAQESESFQKYVDANEARIEAEARAERLAGALREMLELRQATQDGRVTARHELEIVRDARAALEQEQQE